MKFPAFEAIPKQHHPDQIIRALNEMEGV